MRADGGRLQLGVVISIDTSDGCSLLIAVKNGSRLLPGAQIPPQECRYVHLHQSDVFSDKNLPC